MPDEQMVTEEQLISKPGESPDFYLFLADRPIIVTKAWDRATPGRDGYPVIGGIGSSSVEDGHGHIFEKSALERIQATAVPGTPDARVWNGHQWITHQYVGQIDKPFELLRGGRDAHGRFVEADGGDVWALRASNWVDTDFDHNKDTILYLEKGRDDPALQLGYSVGVIYEDVVRRVDRSRGVICGLRIKSAAHKELSLTGMPANSASWIEYGRRPFVTKGFIPANDRDLRQTEYAIRNFDGLPPELQPALLQLNDLYRRKLGLVLVPDPTAKHLW